jgi:hypothetical protein
VRGCGCDTLFWHAFSFSMAAPMSALKTKSIRSRCCALRRPQGQFSADIFFV